MAPSLGVIVMIPMDPSASIRPSFAYRSSVGFAITCASVTCFPGTNSCMILFFSSSSTKPASPPISPTTASGCNAISIGAEVRGSKKSPCKYHNLQKLPRFKVQCSRCAAPAPHTDVHFCKPRIETQYHGFILAGDRFSVKKYINKNNNPRKRRRGLVVLDKRSGFTAALAVCYTRGRRCRSCIRHR